MVEIGRFRTVRLLLPLFVLLGLGAFPTAAGADPLEELGTQVQKVTATLAPPVKAATAAVEPGAKEAGTVTAPAEQAAAGVRQTVRHAADPVTKNLRPSDPPAAGTAAEESLGQGADASGWADKALAGAAEPAAGGSEAAPAPPSPAAPSAAPAPDSSGAAATDAAPTAPTQVDREAVTDRNSMAPDPGRVPGPGLDTFQAPSADGAIRAPFTKLEAYVWPAISLGRSALGGFVGSWERRALQLAAGPPATDGGSGGAIGIAGVHAGHVAEQPPISLRSLLTGLPPFGATWSPQLPPTVLILYLAVALGTLGVYLTILWDLGVLADFFYRRGRYGLAHALRPRSR